MVHCMRNALTVVLSQDMRKPKEKEQQMRLARNDMTVCGIPS